MGLALLAVALAAVQPVAQPCATPVPRGPAVPAPIVFRTTCEALRLDPDGHVTRLPRGWVARHSGGTGRRFGADLSIRRTPNGSITLLRGKRVVWRARDLYPNDAGGVAFGPSAFAFAAFHRGVFLTDLKTPERLVVAGRGLHPYAFTSSGRLVVIGAGRIVVVTPEGTIERRHAFRLRHGLAFDEARDELYFVRGDRRLVVVADGGLPRVIRPVRDDLGWMSLPRAGRLLLFEGAKTITLMRRDGREVARAEWPLRPPFRSDSGVSVSPDGRALAFRLSDGRPGAASGTAAVFLLRAGEKRPVELFRRRLKAIGCGVGATIRWHGRFLLYTSTDGEALVGDRATREVRDLTSFASKLPRRSAGDHATVAWASEFRGALLQIETPAVTGVSVAGP